MRHHRLDQLSDGIFAIVMTILVFEIRLPEFLGTPGNNLLLFELKNLLPSLLSYALTFALLFTYWRAHHFFISTYAKNVDLMLTNINALFFLLISLVPFSASMLGRYSDSPISVAVFGCHIMLIGFTLYLMRHYVLYSEHIKNPEITHREIFSSTVRTIMPIIFAVIAIAISFINIKFSLAFFMLAVLFNLSSTSTKVFEKIFRVS